MISKKLVVFLVVLSVLISSVTFQTYKFITITYTIISLIAFLRVREKFDKLLIGIVSLILFVSLGQALIFNTFSLYNFVGPFLVFVTPFFILKITGISYFRYYVQVIYILAIISLVFWVLQNLSPGFTLFLSQVSYYFRLDPVSNESLIIYNIEGGRSLFGLYKNAGFTAEGGLYCVFLIPALYINTLLTPGLINRKNSVLIFSILSTFSTAAFAALAIFLIYIAVGFKNKILVLFVFPLVLFSLFNLGKDLPFLFSKVEKRYNDEMNVYKNEVNPARRGRFLSARVDMDIIAKNPLIGRGIYDESRYLNEEEREIGYSNSYLGLVGLASRYGLILWSLYLFFLAIFIFRFYKWANIRSVNIRKSFPVFFLLSTICVATGQNPFYTSIYVIMTYTGYYIYKSKRTVRASLHDKFA
jgi:hypothetical protein